MPNTKQKSKKFSFPHSETRNECPHELWTLGTLQNLRDNARVVRKNLNVLMVSAFVWQANHDEDKSKPPFPIEYMAKPHLLLELLNLLDYLEEEKNG